MVIKHLKIDKDTFERLYFNRANTFEFNERLIPKDTVLAITHYNDYNQILYRIVTEEPNPSNLGNYVHVASYILDDEVCKALCDYILAIPEQHLYVTIIKYFDLFPMFKPQLNDAFNARCRSRTPQVNHEIYYSS